MKYWFEFFYGKSSPLTLDGKIVISPILAFFIIPAFSVIDLLFTKEFRR